MRLDALVEGVPDEVVARKLIEHTGHEFGTCYGKKGWTYIRDKARGFANAARHSGLLIVVDFADTGLDCVATMYGAWIGQSNPRVLCRGAVGKIESWVLADRVGIATKLNVPVQRIPLDVDSLPDPKATLISVAAHSKSRSVKANFLPLPGIRASQGPLYASELSSFVATAWDVDRAAEHSQSLNRCIARLRAMHGVD
jgi:hypothetical protein